MINEGHKTTSITHDTILVMLSLLIMVVGTFEFACYVQTDSFAPNPVTFGIALFVILLAGAVLIYNRYSAFSNRFFVFLIPILFLISCMLLFVLGNVFGTTLYMISGILFAKYVNKYFGLFILFELCFLFQIVNGFSATTEIFHFMLGTLVCVLFPVIKNIVTGLYFMVVETAIGILLYFVLQLFPISDGNSIELFPLLLSFVILITICGVFSFVYDKTTENVSVEIQALLCACEETVENTGTEHNTNSKEVMDFETKEMVQENAVETEKFINEKKVEDAEKQPVEIEKNEEKEIEESTKAV